MADLKISQLPAYASGSVAPAIDLIPIVDTTNTTTKAITVAALFIAGLLSPPTIGVTTQGLIPGTIMTGTGFRAPRGGVTAYGFTGDTNTGLGSSATGVSYLASVGNALLVTTGTLVRLSSSVSFGFSSGDPTATAL